MSRRPLIQIAFGVAILIDVLRVFLPSLITIVGSAGSTPAELIGAYALAWFLGAFLAVPVSRLIGGRAVGVVGALLLVAGRAVLPFTDGGQPQLYAASVALLGGLWWLTAAAMTQARELLPGLVWGLALATGLHAALDTVDLVWRGGPVPLALGAIELVIFAVAFVRSTAAGEATAPAPRAMLVVGPALL